MARDIGNYQPQIADFVAELCPIYYRHSQPEDREDIAVEVALIAHQRHREVGAKSETEFRAWLHEITRNVIRNWSRREAKLTRKMIGSFDDEHLLGILVEPADSHTPETNSLLQEKLVAARSAVLALPLIHQQIIWLFYAEELPEREISKRLGIQPGTVKSRLHSARKQLKIRLKRYFEVSASL